MFVWGLLQHFSWSLNEDCFPGPLFVCSVGSLVLSFSLVWGKGGLGMGWSEGQGEGIPWNVAVLIWCWMRKSIVLRLLILVHHWSMGKDWWTGDGCLLLFLNESGGLFLLEIQLFYETMLGWPDQLICLHWSWVETEEKERLRMSRGWIWFEWPFGHWVECDSRLFLFLVLLVLSLDGDAIWRRLGNDSWCLFHARKRLKVFSFSLSVVSCGFTLVHGQGEDPGFEAM